MGHGPYESLAGKLEYCDLRELQDVLTSRSLAAVRGPVRQQGDAQRSLRTTR